MVKKYRYICILPFLIFLFICFGLYAADASEKNIPSEQEYAGKAEGIKKAASFASESDARRLIKKLNKEGKDAFYRKIKSGGKTFYQVFVKQSSGKDTGQKSGEEKGLLVAKKQYEINAIAAKQVPEDQEKADKGRSTEIAEMPRNNQDIEQRMPAPDAQSVTMDFTDYVNKVLDGNPSVRINEHDYRQSQLLFLRTLEAYGINVSLNGFAGVTYDGDTSPGADISLDAVKILYDGGKKQILEKEYEIVKALAKTNLMSGYDTAKLTAVIYYTDFYYNREVLDFLTEQFYRQRDFIQKVESRYQQGLKLTIYDSLTAQSENLKLEKDLLQQKVNLIKAETAFRQFGHIDMANPIRLSPLDVRVTPELEHLQKYAVAHSNLIFSARLREDLERLRISEKKAEGGLRVDATSSVKLQAGSNDFTGGSNFEAGIGLRFSLPLLDGGVRKTDIVAQQIESLKQRSNLAKTTEDVIKQITDLYSDYTNIEKGLEIVKQQLLIDEKRLKVSLERLEKGLEDYRAVRESWNDLIDTKITLLQYQTLSQKLLVDLMILSGKSIFN